MKSVLLWLFLVSLFGGGIQTISRINHYAREAAEAYRQQEYYVAIASYEYLLHDLEVQDDQISLNLAHAYYKVNLLDEALAQYRQLANHPYQHIRAVAALQTGNIAALRGKYKQALSYYKIALIAEPANESARYNYELLKKYLALHPELTETDEAEDEPLAEHGDGPENLEEPPPADEHLAPRPKLKPDTQGTQQEEIESKEQADTGTPDNRSRSDNAADRMSGENDRSGAQPKEQAAGDEAGDTEGLQDELAQDQTKDNPGAGTEPVSEEDRRAQTRNSRLQQMNISPEKARMLLEAMQSAELQYIQQLPKKATKKPDTSKPDW